MMPRKKLGVFVGVPLVVHNMRKAKGERGWGGKGISGSVTYWCAAHRVSECAMHAWRNSISAVINRPPPLSRDRECVAVTPSSFLSGSEVFARSFWAGCIGAQRGEEEVSEEGGRYWYGTLAHSLDMAKRGSGQDVKYTT